MKRVLVALVFVARFSLAANPPQRLAVADPFNPGCMALVASAALSAGGENPVDWLQLGLILGEISSQRSRSTSALVVLAQDTLTENLSTTAKLDRLLLIHAVTQGMSLWHPQEGEDRVTLARDALARFRRDPAAVPYATEVSLLEAIAHAETVLNVQIRPLFERLDRCSLDFKRRFILAGLDEGRRVASVRAATALHLGEELTITYFQAVAADPRRQTALASFRLSDGDTDSLSPAQYEDLLMRSLAANAYAFDELLTAPSNVRVDARLLQRVFAAIDADPYAGAGHTTYDEAEEYVPVLMERFVAMLARMGITARVVYANMPTTELTRENWNRHLKLPLRLLIPETR